MNEFKPGSEMFPSYVSRSSSNYRPFFIIGGIVLILVIIALSGLYLLGYYKKSSIEGLPVVRSEVDATPLPTSSLAEVVPIGTMAAESIYPGPTRQDGGQELDRGSLQVIVLNGSGVTGAARAVSSYLEKLGYKIKRVENADNFSYINLTVIVERSKGMYADLLKRDLDANPAFASVSAHLEDDPDNDVKVIVGR